MENKILLMISAIFALALTSLMGAPSTFKFSGDILIKDDVETDEVEGSLTLMLKNIVMENSLQINADPANAPGSIDEQKISNL